jgi:hypothetical protein
MSLGVAEYVFIAIRPVVRRCRADRSYAGSTKVSPTPKRAGTGVT